METLDPAIRTLWQEFFEASMTRHALEKEIQTEGTFTRKKIREKWYWYKQSYKLGMAVQEYFGPQTAETLKKVASFRTGRVGQLQTVRGMRAVEQRRMALLKRAGLPTLDPLAASIFGKLADLGLLDKGILVGSFAFAAYSGLLGRIFEGGSLKTLDIDLVPGTFSNDKPIEILSPEGFLAVHGKYFHAVPGLSNKALPVSFASQDGFRIDFLAPTKGKPGGIIPVKGISRLGAQTLPFLDFLVKNPVQGTLMAPRRGIPVWVPEPARYAIHKMIIAQRRSLAGGAKRVKDLKQAAQLILACAEESPFELKKAYREAFNRGKKWKIAIERSLQIIPAKARDILA